MDKSSLDSPIKGGYQGLCQVWALDLYLGLGLLWSEVIWLGELTRGPLSWTSSPAKRSNCASFVLLRLSLIGLGERVPQGPLNGGVSNGGVSRSGLVLPFLSFFVLFRTFPIFWDFPDLRGDGPGIFPICPFPLSQPIKSTYEEQSRKGPRHNLDLS